MRFQIGDEVIPAESLPLRKLKSLLYTEPEVGKATDTEGSGGEPGGRLLELERQVQELSAALRRAQAKNEGVLERRPKRGDTFFGARDGEADEEDDEEEEEDEDILALKRLLMGGPQVPPSGQASASQWAWTAAPISQPNGIGP